MEMDSIAHNNLIPTKEKVERLSASEVYLLDSVGRRQYRVCGSVNTFSGSSCLYQAGYRTNHLFKGNCWLHETREGKAIWDIVIGGIDEKTVFGKYLINATCLTDDQLQDINADIIMLYALVGTLQDNRTVITVSDIEQIRKIIREIGKMKEIRGRLDRDMKLEVNTVRDFINRVFSIITGCLDKTSARRVMTQIMEKVVLPLGTGSKDLEDLKLELPNVKKQIASYAIKDKK